MFYKPKKRAAVILKTAALVKFQCPENYDSAFGSF